MTVELPVEVFEVVCYVAEGVFRVVEAVFYAGGAVVEFLDRRDRRQ